ncbi:hypothetical protein BDV33DRAFT_166299 [Aspergillus novoparasiticus]|uniref:Uncharacterized protein n=1 Tax=Aspergillus novoparasiticus TaxID=986946 RepID=A0A5N6F4I3_9EURO|nr:hypothetical protein BDV33DRAFT_166299 [Aspergillus novoparasiticus]
MLRELVRLVCGFEVLSVFVVLAQQDADCLYELSAFGLEVISISSNLLWVDIVAVLLVVEICCLCVIYSLLPGPL